MSVEKLRGTWILLSCGIYDEEGNKHSFFGDAPTGLLMYDECGYMSAQLGAADRIGFEDADWEKVSPQEALAAIATYQSYYGTYRINEEEGTVYHDVLDGIRPSWKGISELRYFSFEDNKLVLKTLPMLMGGKKMVFRAYWKKATPL